ncbi:MAG: NAD-dependent deacylase [Gammaproteobacteria bacterium]
MTRIPPALVECLSTANRILVLSGAGISAESGIPTFRDAMQGLWSRYRPEDLATPAAFLRQPELVWQWYQWRRRLVRDAQPNQGHHALAGLQDCLPDLRLVTQNVDGLHQRAGSKDVVELHGNLFEDRCSNSSCLHAAANASMESSSPPACPKCGALMRPGVVWFGEALPQAALERAQHAASHCQLLFSVGTSAVVYPAADLAWIGKQAGATVVEINPEPTPLTAVADFVLPRSGGEILPALLRALRPDYPDGAHT